MLVGAIGAVVGTLVVWLYYAVWMGTRGEAIFRRLRDAHARGDAPAWIDARYPAAADVQRGNAYVLRERFAALALVGEFDGLARELAALRGDPAWHAIAAAAGQIGIAIAADEPRPAIAELHALLAAAERRRTWSFAPDRMVRPLVALGDALVGAATADPVELGQISRKAPLLRAVIDTGLVRLRGGANLARAAAASDTTSSGAR